MPTNDEQQRPTFEETVRALAAALPPPTRTGNGPYTWTQDFPPKPPEPRWYERPSSRLHDTEWDGYDEMMRPGEKKRRVQQGSIFSRPL